MGATGATSADVCTCPAGMAGDSLNGCSPCPPDTFKVDPGIGAPGDVCLPCSSTATTAGATGATTDDACLCRPGYAGALGNDDCVACPLGTYKDTVASAAQCQSCGPFAMTASLGSTTATACTCLAGFYGDGLTCSPCPADTFKLTSGNGEVHDVCLPCTANSTSNGATGLVSVEDCLCKAGFSGATGYDSCDDCPANSFKAQAGNGEEGQVCLACPTGTTTAGATAAASASACVCFAGYYGLSSGDGACQPCNTDTYKSAVGFGAAGDVCLSCPANSTTSGAVGVSDMSQCMCRAGFFGDANAGCQACGTDVFKRNAGNGDVETCTVCGPLSSSGNQTSISDSSACLCKPGAYGAQGHTSCQWCPVDTYKAGLENAVACTACGPNAVTNGLIGSSSVDACLCKPGFYGSHGVCNPCPADTYKSGLGNGEAAAVCTPCALNATTNFLTAKTASRQCLCRSGFYGSVGDSSCAPCGPNTYKTFAGNGDALSVCSACVSGSTTLGLSGISSATQCLCGPGLYGNSTNGCTACGVDTYKVTAGNGLAADVCVPCASGSSTLGATSITQATGCVCRPGYAGNGNAACSSCPVDSFKPSPGNGAVSTLCQACSSLSTTNGTSAATGSSQCICKAGAYGQTGHTGCTACPADTFKVASGLGSVASCSACPSGSTTNGTTGSSSAGACICNSGYFGGGGGSCQRCPPDTFKATAGNGASSDTCVACPSGSTTNQQTGGSSITSCQCQAGWYGSLGSCAQCPANTYKPGIGNGDASVVCWPCSRPGSSTIGVIGATSSAACQCDAGYAGDGHVSCLECPVNTFKIYHWQWSSELPLYALCNGKLYHGPDCTE